MRLAHNVMTDEGADGDAGAAIMTGLDHIRNEFGVPTEFPAEVLSAADDAAKRDPTGTHVDRTDREFRTLDPASSTDLDQAFAIEVSGSDVVLHYAIADVGFFVSPGDPIDVEAWTRGSTIYLPDKRATLYPTVLCEHAASLLPDGPRPAVIFTVRVDEQGDVRLDGVERAVILSRAKLSYTDVDASSIDGFGELSRRIVTAEERRGAPRVEFPEQELERTDQGWELRFDPRLESEDQNAGMSLATNLAVADAMMAAHTGLFRVMADVHDRSLGRLRHVAQAFHLDWPVDMPLAQFQRSLARDEPRSAAFLLAVRRAGGGASYEPYRKGERPWHAAMAATYAHATAPLRRLADRYVVETALAVANGVDVPEAVEAALSELPAVMARGDGQANRIDAAVLDLAEAVLLADRIGDRFEAVVVDEDDRGPVVQIAEPAILVRVSAARVTPGDEITVQLVAADPAARRVEFRRIA